MAKPNTAGSKKNTAQKGTLRKVLKYVPRGLYFGSGGSDARLVLYPAGDFHDSVRPRAV